MRIQLLAIVAIAFMNATAAASEKPQRSAHLRGSPNWFALGGEVYHARDRIEAQRQRLKFKNQPRWFHGFSRYATKAEYERWRAEQRGKVELQQSPLTDDAGEPLYPLPNPPPFPRKLTDLTTIDRGVRLKLSVQPDRDNALAILATLSTKQLPVFREVEHRWTNITPLLFAFYSDGKAITGQLEGFGKTGGSEQFVELAEPDRPHTWHLTADGQSLLALLPHRRPQNVTIVALFAEKQQTGHFTGDAAAELMGVESFNPRIGQRAMILVRSDPVTLRWTGSGWENGDQDEIDEEPRPTTRHRRRLRLRRCRR
jgi:hypothetical protein